MEVEYYRKANFWSDVLIAASTFKVILSNDGNL
jgi:lipopolysaccharide/colanic/teichoic acid biosynthesis glycosyltransferase